MILTKEKFRNLLDEYNRFVPSTKEWIYFSSKLYNQKVAKDSNKPTSSEDLFIRQMIDNVDFNLLYRSIEFRKILKQRLNYYDPQRKTL